MGACWPWLGAGSHGARPLSCVCSGVRPTETSLCPQNRVGHTEPGPGPGPYSTARPLPPGPLLSGGLPTLAFPTPQTAVATPSGRCGGGGQRLHQPQTPKQAPASGRGPRGLRGTSLLARRCASLSSSWPRRWSTRPAVLASSWASVSLALFMRSSCSLRRVFTCERPVLLDGRNPSGVTVGGWPLLRAVLRDPGPELPGPAGLCSGVEPPHGP